MDQTFQEYLGIRWPARSTKPRTSGLTMVMDTGWPVSFVDSMMQQFGDTLDVAKIWDPHLRSPATEIRKKFAEADSTRTSEDVVNEEVTINEMLALFKAGASYVYWEGHLLRRVMGESAEELRAKRDKGTQQVLRVAEAVGKDRIIFEVSPLRPLLSRRTLQFWLITLFGPEVNIGNARLEELGFLEALRCGSHPVHGFGIAGDYPWIRAIESKKPADYKWWAEALHD